MNSLFYDKPQTFDRDVIGFLSSGCSNEATENTAFALLSEELGLEHDKQVLLRRVLEAVREDAFRCGYTEGAGNTTYGMFNFCPTNN